MREKKRAISTLEKLVERGTMLNGIEVDVMKHARVDLEDKLMQRKEEVKQLEVQRCEVSSTIFPLTVYVLQLPKTLFLMSSKVRATQEANDATAKRKQIEADREEMRRRTKRKDKRLVLLREAAKARKETSKARVEHQVSEPSTQDTSRQA